SSRRRACLFSSSPSSAVRPVLVDTAVPAQGRHPLATGVEGGSGRAGEVLPGHGRSRSSSGRPGSAPRSLSSTTHRAPSRASPSTYSRALACPGRALRRDSSSCGLPPGSWSW
ncbi:hypothetical protein CFC21_081235, partial [Triticum aestivum]